MKTLIIYKSYHHRNTEQIARAMADVLGAKLAQPEEIGEAISPEELAEYDLIGFGSGIYRGRHHQALFALADRLPATGKDAFVFSTSGAARLGRGDQNVPLVRRLEKKGFRVRGVFSCRGWDTMGPLRLIGGIQKGHPDAQDIEDARAFARGLLQDKVGHTP